MHRTKVLLADDHAIVAEGLATLLEGHFDLVGTVGNGSQLIDAARELRPDVIVADIAMPVLSGLEALRHLKEESIDAKVIFLTMHADAQLATEAFRAGAARDASAGCGQHCRACPVRDPTRSRRSLTRLDAPYHTVVRIFLEPRPSIFSDALPRTFPNFAPPANASTILR